MPPPQTVLIVGSGAFGASIARSLLDAGYAGHEHLLTILDRAADPPAIDAASSDLNKIVRQDYADPAYYRLAVEALNRWRSDPVIQAAFHECGLVCAATEGSEGMEYLTGSFEANFTDAQGQTTLLKTPGEVKRAFGEGVPTAPWTGVAAYHNKLGGWAASRDAVVSVVSHLRSRGVQFAQGQAARLLLSPDGKKAIGIATEDGIEYKADLVILAAGAWTPILLHELATELLPTGQVLATVQLTPDEQAQYAKVPVHFNFTSGFYCFPPTKEGRMKFALHAKGYVWPSADLGLPSVPRTVLTPGYESQRLPARAVRELRAGLAAVYPELATEDREWFDERICWYSDRPSGDWLFDWHPTIASLFVAAGGSGHAFKFLPCIGELCTKRMAGTLEEDFAEIFAYKAKAGRSEGSRPGAEDWEPLAPHSIQVTAP